MLRFLKKYINYLLLLIIIILITYLLINRQKQQEFSRDLYYMDTYINVRIFSKNKEKAQTALNEIENIYKEYHMLSDKYNNYKDIINIYYINTNYDKDKYLKIDTKLYDLINYGLDFYDKSNGLLNINMGSITDIWKKYRDKGTSLPTKEELQKQNTDIKKIILKDGQILNNRPNIDLGAISKGYTTKIVGEYLNSIGLDKYIINAGGNVLVGKHYNKGKYRIGIQSPNKDDGLIDVINAENISVVTSGSYERFYEIDGKIYSHIIDPTTLYPSAYMKSVTVITKDSALADALSTTLFLMDIDKGLKFLENYEAEAIWYTNDNQIITSKGIDKYEEK